MTQGPDVLYIDTDRILITRSHTHQHIVNRQVVYMHRLSSYIMPATNKIILEYSLLGALK